MKKVFATLLVGMLAIFSFAAFEVIGGYANETLDATLTYTSSDVTMHGISVGANYLADGLGIEGGALLISGYFDYYFPAEVDEFVVEGVEIDVTDLSTNFSQTSWGINVGYRQGLNPFFPELPFGMYVQGLFNYSFGTVDFNMETSGESVVGINIYSEADRSSWGLGGGVGVNFVFQGLDMDVGADVLFEKVTLTYEETDHEADQWEPKFKIYAGLQF